MKKIIIITITLILLSTIVLAHEENKDCDVNLEKYASLAKETFNKEPKAAKYANRLLGKEGKIQVNIDSEVWHANYEKGQIIEIEKGPVDGEKYNVYTTMCTLHDIEDGELSVKDAVKSKKVSITANSFVHKLKLKMLKLFL